MSNENFILNELSQKKISYVNGIKKMFYMPSPYKRSRTVRKFLVSVLNYNKWKSNLYL